MTQAPSFPDDCLWLGPDDMVHAIGTVCAQRMRRPRAPETVAIVLHRTHGAWTHVYRIAAEPSGRVLVHLERVLPGEATDEAMAWAATRFGIDVQPASVSPTPAEAPLRTAA